MEFGPGIRRSSGHIYTSALPFSPPCCLKRQYGHILLSDYVSHGLPTCWNPNYCTIELPNTVASIAYSPDGSKIAVGTEKGNVLVFNSVTGAEIVAFQESQKSVDSVVFAPDGTRLAFPARQRAMIYDVTTGTLLVTLDGHTSSITFAGFASDGTKVVTGSDDSTLRVWDSQNGRVISCRSSAWVWGSGHPSSVALSPDTATIARAIRGAIEIWDWNSNHPLRILAPASSDSLSTVQFLCGNVQLVQTYHYKLVEIWDYQVGALLKSIEVIAEIFISPFGYQMAECEVLSGEVKIWDTETWSVVGVLIEGDLPKMAGSVFSQASLAFSPNGCMLAYAPCESHIGVWRLDRSCRRTTGSVDPLHDTQLIPDAVAVSANGSQVVCSVETPKNRESRESLIPILKVWDLALASSPKIQICDQLFTFLTWSPDGRLFMSLDSFPGE